MRFRNVLLVEELGTFSRATDCCGGLRVGPASEDHQNLTIVQKGEGEEDEEEEEEVGERQDRIRRIGEQ